MKASLAAILVSIAVFCAPAASYGAAPTHYGTWGIGHTGLLCYQLPCPWRGVFPIGADGERGRPISQNDQAVPPSLRGQPEDIERISQAYADGGCLTVKARFDGPVLDVDRIIGTC